MMDRAPPSTDGARVAVRLGGDYVLRSLRLQAELSGGQLMLGLVSLAITQANVAHLVGDEGRPYKDLEALPPDEVRRPVSVLSVAQSLGLPYETTRRHVETLIRMGRCQRVRGGVIVPAAAFDTPRHRELLAVNLANLRRLYRGLRAVDVDLS
jgi:hypothetical protein